MLRGIPEGQQCFERLGLWEGESATCEIARFGTDPAFVNLAALLQETVQQPVSVLFRRPHRRLRGPGLAPSSWQTHAISLRRAALRESYISWRCPGRLDDSSIRFLPGDNSIPYSGCRDAIRLLAICCVPGAVRRSRMWRRPQERQLLLATLYSRITRIPVTLICQSLKTRFLGRWFFDIGIRTLINSHSALVSQLLPLTHIITHTTILAIA